MTLHTQTTERAHVFEPVAQGSVADAVVAQIEQLIVSGVLRGGQKLPSERELSEMMDVSRPKVRDALKTLEERGLVRARQGDGTFIAVLTGAALSPAMIELFARHGQAFTDYLEFRAEIEGFAAHLAAARATAEDRDLIGRIMGEMTAAHRRADPRAETEIDVAFHLAVVDAAHNAMLTTMMSSIYELMQRGVFYNRDTLYRRPGARDKLLAQHQAIAEAVLAREPERAARAAEAHMAFVGDEFADSAAEQSRAAVARRRLALFERRARGRRGGHGPASAAPPR